jgi:hypothetical protein
LQCGDIKDTSLWNFEAGRGLCWKDFGKKHASDPMGNPLTLSLWLGVLLYAAAGMVGVVLFHDAGPIAGSLTGGYGIVYTTVAASKLDK